MRAIRELLARSTSTSACQTLAKQSTQFSALIKLVCIYASVKPVSTAGSAGSILMSANPRLVKTVGNALMKSTATLAIANLAGKVFYVKMTLTNVLQRHV